MPKTSFASMPKISVYTPSHNTQYLDEVLKSLLSQTFKDFEWVVLLNGPAVHDEKWRTTVNAVCSNDSSGCVGALKAEAVSHCEGEILVELDHDDVLSPDALEKIARAFDDPAVNFVFSDFSQINADGTPNMDEFDSFFGWTYRMEGEYKVPNLMPATPHNTSLIWYAPNHVRAFRRSLYDAAGGYNPSLSVLDDQDLMARMYALTDFTHIPELLYYQRIHGGNTQTERNALIQQQTLTMYDQYIDGAVRAWAGRNSLDILDLGGAHNAPYGWKTVDLKEPADIVGDIFNVLGDIDDNTIGAIRACDFMEHISDKVRLINEIWRVLVPGGYLLSLTPSSDGRGAFQDPTHTSFYNENSFWYYTNKNGCARYVPAVEARFQESVVKTFFPSPWHEAHKISYVQANLIALKDDNQPVNGGPVHF